MGDVVPLVRPLAESRIIDALREITDDTTEGVAIVTISPSQIGLRTFGPSDLCARALRAAAAEISNDTDDMKHMLWMLLGDVKARAVSCQCSPPPTKEERGNIERAEALLAGYEPID